MYNELLKDMPQKVTKMYNIYCWFLFLIPSFSPALYAPAQAHALAKQKLNSSGLKRPHSQISIPQHPFNQRHTPPNSPPATPKKPLPELKRCPFTQPSQSVSAQSASAPITVPSPARSHLTPPTLTLPLRSSSSGGSLLATKQLLRIALSSASAQCTNGQSKTATVSPPHDLIQSKPLISPVLAKPECPTQPLRTPNPCPQLVQLSPSRQTTAATPLITTPPLASPQRASPPSPVLPLVSTSSILAPLQSLLSPTQTAETSKEPKDRKEEQKEGHVPLQTPQDLKCPAPQEKITQPVTVNQPSSKTTEKVINYSASLKLLRIHLKELYFLWVANKDFSMEDTMIFREKCGRFNAKKTI